MEKKEYLAKSQNKVAVAEKHVGCVFAVEGELKMGHRERLVDGEDKTSGGLIWVVEKQEPTE